MGDIMTRPKILRTYGSRRPETAADDNVQAGSILITRHSSEPPKSPSAVANSSSPSPTKPSSASSSYAFAWMTRLRDIDKGLEDDNLSAILAAKNAYDSPPPVSSSGSPPPAPPLFSCSTPATPSPMPADLTRPVSVQSPPVSPTPPVSNSASLTRKQISSLSISSPDTFVHSSTSKPSNGRGAKAANTGTTPLSSPGERPVVKTKKLSKKEEQEINKETARMLAGQHVSIKTDWRPKQRSMNALFSLLKHESSDPIEGCSSPGERTLVESSSAAVGSTSMTDDMPTPVTARARAPPPRLPDTNSSADRRERLSSSGTQLMSLERPTLADNDSDDEDVMDPQTLLKNHVSQPLLAKAALEKKMVWLKGQAGAHDSAAIPEDDDDIEIIRPLPRATSGPVPKLSAPASGRSSFLTNTVSIVKRPAHVSRHALVDIRKRPLLTKGPQPDLLGELNTNLLRRAEAQRAAVRAEKEADWVRRGGILKDTRALGGPHISELMQQASGSENEEGKYGGSDDEEDQDYRPPDEVAEVPSEVISGFEADATGRALSIEGDGSNGVMPSFLSQSTTSTAASASSLLPSSKPVVSDSSPPPSESSDTELADSQAVPIRLRQGRIKRASRRVIIDEDEEVENTVPPPDSDAENARPAMDDSDLENMPPVIQQVATVETDDEDTGTPGRRSPLKRLKSFSSSSFSLGEIGPGPSTSRRMIGAAGSPRSAPLSELDGGTLSETEVEPDADFGMGGMSQLFGVNTQDEQSQQRANGLHRPTRSFDFSTQLTLLPAVQISETKWKMNDEIFLQQQQDGVESRSVTLSPRAIDPFRRPLGNGQNSFLTDFESQNWTQPVPSHPEQVSSLVSEHATTSEINATQSFIEPPQNAVRGLRRIQRGRRVSKSPSPRAPSLTFRTSSPTQPTQSLPRVSRDAFKVLMSNPRREPVVPRELVETYMEGEAEESDEEIAFGFGGGAGLKADEDEGADEEPAGEDGHIKDLVDDREMDPETQAKDKILEKVQEHAAEDDARALKIAQDAVDGNFRNGRRKRQRGLGEFDSGDSSDEEDRPKRPKIEKKRRIEGDKLQEFGKNPETAAFFKVYMRGIDDDGEVAYDGTFTDGGENDAQSVDSDMSEDESGHISMREEREIVTAAQLRLEIREKAKSLKEAEVFDPMDVNWYQDDDHADDKIDDDELGIEVEVLPSIKPRGLPKTLDDEWVALASARESGPQDALATTESQLASFARGRSNNGGAVNGRGADVTGYSIQERGKKPTMEVNARTKRTLKAAPSVLSVLTARTRDKFQ